MTLFGARAFSMSGPEVRSGRRDSQAAPSRPVLRSASSPATRLLATAFDASYGIRVLRAPFPPLRQREYSRHERKDAITLRRPVRQGRYEFLDIVTSHLRHLHRPESWCGISSRLPDVLTRRALTETARRDPLRNRLVEELLERKSSNVRRSQRSPLNQKHSNPA